MEQFNSFISNFELSSLEKNNNYGKISMIRSLKKISEETGLFSIEFEEEKNIQKN